MKKILFALAVGLSGFVYSQHKFLEIPKLSEEDLKSEKSAKFGDVPAEVLYRSTHFRIDYDGNLYQNVVSRVKIYNKDNASDYLGQEIGVYDDNRGSRETLSNLKANTYNFENGKTVTTKISKDEKFKSKEDKNYNITKFAFANVKNGSVVEYSYTLLTPFLSSTPRVLIEEEIPARYVEYVLDSPKPLGYTINYKGDLSPTHRVIEEKQMYGNAYQTYRFAYENVPAYKEEKYVMNNNNYKTGIKAELNSTLINDVFKSYATNWEDIRQRLYQHEDFGLQLDKDGLVKNLLPAEIKDLPTLQKADAVLKFVQKNYTWNKQDEVFTDKGIRNLISTKVGNTAEINLMLTMLLRSVGINADPVVLSTVNRGFLLAYNPSISQLNYVVASFLDKDKIYLLDGAYKHSEMNMIAPKALNYYGLIMGKKDVKQINIFYPEVSKTLLTVDAKLNPDGTIDGHFTDRDTKLYAMVVNERYVEDKEKFVQSYKNEYKFALSNMKHNLHENNDFETMFDFSSDTFVDAIGSKLVFNPLLFLYAQNHDFKQDTPRKAPLEFYSPSDRVKKVTITLPDNYVFENVPKSKKFRTQDNALQYTYQVTQTGNKLTVETTTQIDDSVFPKEYYPAFTQIYDNITQQEAQVVTAVKKSL
ncbi:MAG: transglutaminase domain-containing protein [Kaistella sp.]